MSKLSQPTLSDIARRLKVSKVTISKALRDHPDISIETKQKVKKAARELGYVPNLIARNLSTKSSHTIGLIVPKIAHHFFATAIESIYSAASERNYEIIMTLSQENAVKERMHIESLLSMRVDGLLVSVSEQTKEHDIFKKVKDMGIPLVFFDRTIEGLGFSGVKTDDRQCAYIAVKHAIEIGYTKIAHLAGYNYTSIGTDRYNGFLDAMNEFNIPVHDEWIIEGGFGEKDGYHSFIKLFKTNRLPEIVFAVTFPVAMGMYTAVEEIGLVIPKDVDVIAFGGSDYNRFFSPSMTFVDQPAAEIGKRAIEILLEEIKNPDLQEERHIALPGELIICQTCRKETEDI
jgi:LacI family transcriptional regulator